MSSQSTELRDSFSEFVQDLQDRICAALEHADGKATFQEDLWERTGGGGGRTRVIAGGNVFEKGGVNFSKVHGPLTPEIQKGLDTGPGWFYATGISLVIHPRNPFVPTTHANFRYFELRESEDGPLRDAWFGGGADLTPYYLDPADGKYFHQVLKDACDQHGPEYYPKFKAWCDEYFTNHHRGTEMRGIGGVFFDWLRQEDGYSYADRKAFTETVGNAFIPAYIPIVERTKDKPYNESHVNWQEIRRGRYAEFNLIHDRGTKFGLQSDGRIESILMSLPPRAQWHYNYHPAPGTPEAEMMQYYEPMNWV